MKSFFGYIVMGLVISGINKIAFPMGWCLLVVGFVANLAVLFLQWQKERQMEGVYELDSRLGDSDVESTEEIKEI